MAILINIVSCQKYSYQTIENERIMPGQRNNNDQSTSSANSFLQQIFESRAKVNDLFFDEFSFFLLF